jgi:hypothetical protein
MTKYLQISEFPAAIMERIDAAAGLVGIKREELVIELLDEATLNVKELEERLRDERERRLKRIKPQGV